MAPQQFGQASTSSKLVKTPPPLSKRSVKLNETPLSKKVSGAMPYTSMHYKRDTRMKELGEEMKGKFAGPISPLAFLKTFLPFQKGELARMPRRQKQMFQRVANMKKESSMYKPMIGALKRYCPGFNLVDTHSHPDMSVTNEPEIKPDVSLYESGCRKDPNVVTDISLIDMIMEFKLDPKDDPFRDNGTFEHDTVQSADTRGQITTYATKQLASQFRTHAFSVVICKDMARLIYWDRSGAVVTESFSYVEQPWLANFCWRYTHSSRQVRGIDESVTMPTDVDAAQAHRARVALELDDDKPLFKFAIYCEEGGDVSYCFGSKPWFKGNGSPTGRATRVFIVYDPVLDRRVLMKDTWRVSLDGMQTEGAIYRRLHAANVSHIARFLRGGDVISPFCRTRSHKFARQFCLKLRPHSHYRFTLDDIGRDLTSFTTTKELVETMAGAFQAHTEAVDNARILHRDISIGNVIISDRGGLLIDWDLSKDVDDLANISRQPYRTGTWQFIAARLLQARESVTHTPADDWESFFHVLSWVVLRFTKHGLDSASLTYELRNIYDDWYVAHGKVCGGVNKARSIKDKFIFNDAQVPPGPLLDLLRDLVDVCAVRYEAPPTREDQEEYEHLLTAVARDPSLAGFLVKHPTRRYHDRNEKLKASWMLERFKEAANSHEWDMGPGGRRSENLLTQVDEIVITKKRQSEFETDMPRQSKRFKSTLDDDDASKEEGVEVEEETDDDELDANEDENTTGGDELDDQVLEADIYYADTDWEPDEDDAVDEDASSSKDEQHDELPTAFE